MTICWKKKSFVLPPEQLTNLQPGPSCKTRPIRAAKVKGTGKLSDVMKIQNEEERKMGLDDKQQ